MSSTKSRLQWLEEAIATHLRPLNSTNNGLRQAAREFGLPVTTLKRYIDGVNPLNAKPGPANKSVLPGYARHGIRTYRR